MKRPVIWSRDSLDELNIQTQFIARENPPAARRVIERIFTTGDSLEDFATGHPGRVADTYEKSVQGLPYVIGYAGKLAFWHQIIGVLIAVLSAYELWQDVGRKDT